MVVFILLLVFFYASHSWLASLVVKQFINKQSPTIFNFYRLFYTLFSVTLWGIITWWFIYKHEYNYLFPQSPGLTCAGYISAAVGLLIISLSIIKYGFMEFSVEITRIHCQRGMAKQITSNSWPIVLQQLTKNFGKNALVSGWWQWWAALPAMI